MLLYISHVLNGIIAFILLSHLQAVAPLRIFRIADADVTVSNLRPSTVPVIIVRPGFEFGQQAIQKISWITCDVAHTPPLKISNKATSEAGTNNVLQMITLLS